MRTRFLIVDDSELVRKSLRTVLQANPEWEICGEAADGETAVEALEQTFHVLLTDIVMPGIDGIELARIAAARQPQMRIMFITGFAAVALSAGRAPAGAKVLAKPVHLREIVAEVERMIAA